MTLDLHIHARTPLITDDILMTFFASSQSTRYYSPVRLKQRGFSTDWREAYDVLYNTPFVHVGHVILPMSAPYADIERFMPTPYVRLIDYIGTDAYTVVTDGLICNCQVALSKDDQQLSPEARHSARRTKHGSSVVEFLKAHKDGAVICLTW